MGLFGKKKGDEQGSDNSLQNGQTGAVVEPIAKNSEELKNLLDEFRGIRAGVKAQDEEEIIEEVNDDYVDGDEYEVSEWESESIEDFLATDDVEEEIVEDEYQELEEEVVEDEIIEDEEAIDEEVVEDEVEEEIVEDDYQEIVETDEEVIRRIDNEKKHRKHNNIMDILNKIERGEK